MADTFIFSFLEKSYILTGTGLSNCFIQKRLDGFQWN